MFRTTYVCEQTFSNTMYVKSLYRTRLTDVHLKTILLVGCSNSKANIDIIVKAKRQFHESHFFAALFVDLDVCTERDKHSFFCK